MSSVIFSLVTGYEMVAVHEIDALLEAASEAGIRPLEVCGPMYFSEKGAFLKVETTRRIPKASPKRVKAEKADTPEVRAGRIFNLACQYAAIPAAFDDRLTSDYSPLDG